MILLAILLPPAAVLMATKNPIRTLIAALLWLLGWIPGSIYAVICVNEAKTGKAIRESEKRIIKSQRY